MHITLVLGLFVKSEQLWDIIPDIENLESASANHSAVLTNHSAVLNQHDEKIQILEGYHGKFNFV